MNWINVCSFDEQPLEIRSLTDVLGGQLNAVYVNDVSEGVAAKFTEEDWGADPPAVILDPSRAKIEHFDVNRLIMTVNVPTKKFLVYTDSFTKYWKVFINGRPEKLLRADAAFKGVWLPAGKSKVEFRYDPPGGGWIYVLVTAVLFCFFILTIVALGREKNWPWEERSNEGAF